MFVCCYKGLSAVHEDLTVLVLDNGYMRVHIQLFYRFFYNGFKSFSGVLNDFCNDLQVVKSPKACTRI